LLNATNSATNAFCPIDTLIFDTKQNYLTGRMTLEREQIEAIVKQLLRKIFSPLLSIFEAGDNPYNYKKSQRTILLIIGAIFLILSILVTIAGAATGEYGAMFPSIIFLAVSVTCLVIGFLGTERAVAKIWGNK